MASEPYNIQNQGHIRGEADTACGHDHEQKHEHHQKHHHKHHHGHHHGHHHAHAPNNRKGLTIALLVTSGIMLLELIGGWITNSLALLSDAGHMLSDAAAIALSLLALHMSAKAADAKRTFGYYRFEILAALLNGTTLFVIAILIIKEAYGRFLSPEPVASGAMMAIAAVGLLANLISAWALRREGDIHDNVNVRSAYLHVLGDALGSIGAIGAGALMLLFGWYAADPLISVFVSLLILRGAWRILNETLHVLMEGTPPSVDTEAVLESLKQLDRVREVHDLHIWTITSGLDALTCHLIVDDGTDEQQVLQQAIQLLESRFGIDHSTIQIETASLRHAELKI